VDLVGRHVAEEHLAEGATVEEADMLEGGAEVVRGRQVQRAEARSVPRSAGREIVREELVEGHATGARGDGEEAFALGGAAGRFAARETSLAGQPRVTLRFLLREVAEVGEARVVEDASALLGDQLRPDHGAFIGQAGGVLREGEELAAEDGRSGASFTDVAGGP
jgi:hypothetical protein